MWEYRWVEVPVGDDGALDDAGFDGWEAVGLTGTGTNFGKTYVGVLLKRPRVVTLTEVPQPSARTEWSPEDVGDLLPAARAGRGVR